MSENDVLENVSTTETTPSRESLSGKTLNEIKKIVSDWINDYKASMETKTMDELDAEESAIMEEFKSNEEYLGNRKYTLPEKITFDLDSKEYTINDISRSILRFLNGLELEWGPATLCYKSIIAWKTIKNIIPYVDYDNTLSLLNKMKFKGESDLKDIILVNNLLTTVHLEYSVDKNWLIFLYNKHQIVLKAKENLNNAASKPRGSLKRVKPITEPKTNEPVIATVKKS